MGRASARPSYNHARGARRHLRSIVPLANRRAASSRRPGSANKTLQDAREIARIARLEQQPIAAVVDRAPGCHRSETPPPAVRARNASWITSGLFSGQIDGTTSTSIVDSASATRSCGIGPWTRTSCAADSGSICVAIAVVAVIRGRCHRRDPPMQRRREAGGSPRAERAAPSRSSGCRETRPEGASPTSAPDARTRDVDPSRGDES